jgi:hypothetical protein
MSTALPLIAKIPEEKRRAPGVEPHELLRRVDLEIGEAVFVLGEPPGYGGVWISGQKPLPVGEEHGGAGNKGRVRVEPNAPGRMAGGEQKQEGCHPTHNCYRMVTHQR